MYVSGSSVSRKLVLCGSVEPNGLRIRLGGPAPGVIPRPESVVAPMALRIGRATLCGLMTSSRKQQVLIAGAGVAGLEAALALQALTDGEVSVDLVGPDGEFPNPPL